MIRRVGKRDPTFYLKDPLPPNIVKGSEVVSTDFNLWSRALAFYAGGKVADSFSLVNMLHECHQLMIRDALCATREYPGEAFRAGVGVWDSEQLHRQLLLLNRNRLECERASTTLIVQALEFIIKSMCIHCNYHVNGDFSFAGGHDIDELYTSLPYCCQDEIEAESRRFWSAYAEDRDSALKAMWAIVEQQIVPHLDSPAADRAVENGLLQIKRIVASKKYLDVYTQPETWVHGPVPEGGWLKDALMGAGGLIGHRYGPIPPRNGEWVSARDPYSEIEIGRAQLAARFFLEHLFGVSDPSNNPWQCGA